MTAKPKKTKAMKTEGFKVSRFRGFKEQPAPALKLSKSGTLRPKQRKGRSRPGKAIELRASVEDDLLFLAEEDARVEARWNRPRKRRVSMRMDTEVVEWLQSQGSGYQTRINRILRRVMMESKKRAGEG